MAERKYTETILDFGAIWVEWTGLLLNDTGEPYVAPAFGDKSVQAIGLAAGVGSEVTIEGSNNKFGQASPQWDTLEDQNGTNLVFLNATTEKLKAVVQNVIQIRPNVTAGDGSTSVTVRMLVSTAGRRG